MKNPDDQLNLMVRSGVTPSGLVGSFFKKDKLYKQYYILD